MGDKNQLWGILQVFGEPYLYEGINLTVDTMGGLPDAVRTHLMTSEAKDTALLIQFLLN